MRFDIIKTRNMLSGTLLVGTIIVLQNSCGVNSFETVRFKREEDSCTTPNGDPGICIPIKECKDISDLIDTNKKNYSVINFIRKSQCGVYVTPKVCCKDSGYKLSLPTAPSNLATSNIKVSTEKVPLPTTELPLSTQPSHIANVATFDHLPRECGKSGVSADNAWPWLVFLIYPRGDDIREWQCGGFLVTNKHVLTAAHCVYLDKPDQVRLAQPNRNPTTNETHVDIKIDKFIRHPDCEYKYCAATDIAIIVLSTPVTFTNSIQPICLPNPSKIRNKDIISNKMYFVGWSDPVMTGLQISSRLMMSEVEPMSIKNCSQHLPNPRYYKANLNESVFCARSAKPIDNHRNDGLPVMAEIGDQMYAIGIAFCATHCRLTSGLVNSKIPYHINWIAANTI